MACKGIDEQVVRQDTEIEQLEKQFVCVRVVKMDGVDLELFQFDYDQTFCAVLFNADGTIYARYGTREGAGDHSNSHISLASLKKTLQRALEVHAGYPANRQELVGKRGAKPPFAVAENIPGMEKHHCIHCHQVRETILRWKWQHGTLMAQDLFEYPLPENVGLKMDVDDGIRVARVEPGSPADRAGVKAGDQLVLLGGERMLSQADIQWVLRNVPSETEVPMTVMRSGERHALVLRLAGNWKETDLSWRASSVGLRRGVRTQPLSAAEKRSLGIAPDNMALKVMNIYDAWAGSVRRAGLHAGDVIVAVNGHKSFLTETQFLAHLRLDHGPHDRIGLTVLRGRQKVDVDVPLW